MPLSIIRFATLVSTLLIKPLTKLITQIFYSLVLFPHIQYNKDIGDGYMLESLSEKEHGVIE